MQDEPWPSQYQQKGSIDVAMKYLAAASKLVCWICVILLSDLLLSPLILTADLVLLFRREVVLDVEGLTDLLGGFALDHVGNSLAPNVKERLDVKVIGSLGVDISRRSPLP